MKNSYVIDFLHENCHSCLETNNFYVHTFVEKIKSAWTQWGMIKIMWKVAWIKRIKVNSKPSFCR